MAPTPQLSNEARLRRLQALRRKVPAEEKLLSSGKIPAGYTLVRKGNPYLTRNCRLATHDASFTVYVVHHPASILPIGIAVPTEIFDIVSTQASATASARASAVAAKDKRDAAATQVTLKRLFPDMPASDANAVAAHAFAKGSGRVGRKVTGLDEETRAKRAVVAYARHQYTQYDQLLKTHDREEARDEVRKELEHVLKRWEGKEDPKGNPNRKERGNRGENGRSIGKSKKDGPRLAPGPKARKQNNRAKDKNRKKKLPQRPKQPTKTNKQTRHNRS